MKWDKSRFIYLAVGLAVTGLTTGCVSTSKYKKLETDSNAQINDLNRKVSTLEQEKAAIQMDKENLAKSSEKTEQSYNAILSQMADEVQKGDLKVTQYKNMLTVDMAEKIFFASGSANLKEEGKAVLGKLASALANYPDKIIWAVGHTDNVPVSKATQATFPSNWELSVIRATNVVRYLQTSGVKPEVLIASGRSEYAPIAENDSKDGRQKNRRIEIRLIDRSLLENLKEGEKPAAAETSEPAPAPTPAPAPANP